MEFFLTLYIKYSNILSNCSDKKVFALSPLSHFVERVVSTCERSITTPHVVRSPPGRRASKAMQESKVPAHIYLICSAADALSWDAACIARPFLLRTRGSCWTETRGYLAARLVVAAARRLPARAGPLLSSPALWTRACIACPCPSLPDMLSSPATRRHQRLRQPRRPNSPALSFPACLPS
jgi:hypothetical protein